MISTAALCISLCGLTGAMTGVGHYQFNDPMPVRVSNVRPFHQLYPYNQTYVTYPYDLLPWPCKPKNPNGITDERSRESLYQIHFQRSTNKQTVCGEKELSAHYVNPFIEAISDEYRYEMWVDNLPVFGRVGFAQPNEMSGRTLYFLITHRHFHIRYNRDQVITVNISTHVQPGHYVEIKKDTPLDQVHFTYSVGWQPTEITYSQRWEQQMQSNPTRLRNPIQLLVQTDLYTVLEEVRKNKEEIRLFKQNIQEMMKKNQEEIMKMLSKNSESPATRNPTVTPSVVPTSQESNMDYGYATNLYADRS
eukprot:1165852_1